MNEFFQKLISTAEDAGELAKSLVDQGIQVVQGEWGKLSIFGSISALAPSSESLERDETHYLLVPMPGPDYAVYSKRVIPSGIGATNSLPKARVFHVPDHSGQQHLEEILKGKAIEAADWDAGSPLADRLDLFADEIDRQTRNLSGGMLLIGGAVALVNPIAGAGIAIQAIAPSLTASATKAGTGFLGDKLRDLVKTRAEARVEKEAEQTIRKMKPEIYHNAVLQSLDALFSNSDQSYDPFVDSRNWIDEFEEFRYFQITSEAIGNVFSEELKQRKSKTLTGDSRKWVQHLCEIGAETSQ